MYKETNFETLKMPDVKEEALAKQSESCAETKKLPSCEVFYKEYQELFGMLGPENKLYKDLREVLDKVLVVSGMNPEEVKFDCILSPEKIGLVFPDEKHIFLSLGILTPEDKSESSLDYNAAIFAHELSHIKQKTKGISEKKKESEIDDNVRTYIQAKEKERQADIESLELTNTAGFNPQAVIEVMKGLSEKEEYEDYFEYALDKVQGMVYDPHESLERRVSYLEKYLKQHLFRNRDKQLETIDLQQIDLTKENYGFLHLLNQGKIDKALDSVSKAWHLIYIVNFLQREKIPIDNFKDKIESLKETRLYPELADFSESEKKAFWEAIISPSVNYTAEQIKAMTEENIDWGKIMQSLPELFPESNLQYIDAPRETISPADISVFSPLEKIVSAIVASTGTKEITKTILSAYHEKHPQWLTSFLMSLGFTIKRYENSALWNEAKYFLTNILSEAAKRHYQFTNEHKGQIFKLLLDHYTANDFVQHETTIKSFINKCLSNETPGHNFGQYLNNKFEFLRRLDEQFHWSKSAQNRYNILMPATKDFDPQRRAVLLDLYKPEEIDTMGAMKHWNRPRALPWEKALIKAEVEAADEDEEIVKEGTEGNYIHDYSKMSSTTKQIRGWQLTPYQFWYLVFQDITPPLPKKEGMQSSIKQFISFDVDPYIAARLLTETAMPILEEIKIEKAEKIKNILELEKNFNNLSKRLKIGGQVRHNEISELPAITERNYLILNVIENTNEKDKLSIYQSLKDLLIEETIDQRRDAINEEIKQGEFYQKLLTNVLTEGIAVAYKKNIMGQANCAAEEAASLVWEQQKEKEGFDKLKCSERIKHIENLFPSLSLKKEELFLKETEAENQKEWEMVLNKLTFPMFRYEAGEKLFEITSREEKNNSLQQQIDQLIYAFPEASFYRDEHIIKTLLNNTSTFGETEEAKKLLFSPNTLDYSNGSQIYSLLGFRSLNQLLYFAHPYIKSRIFTELMAQVDSQETIQKFLTPEERKEILNNFFEGSQSILNNPDFRIALEAVFLKHSFSEEIVRNIISIKIIDRELKGSIDYEEERRNIQSDEEESEGRFERQEYIDDNIYGLDPEEIYNRLQILPIGRIEELYRTEYYPSLIPEIDDVEKMVEESGQSFDMENSDRRMHRFVMSAYRKKLNDSLPPGIKKEFPIAQKVFFEILDTLPQQEQAQTTSRFLAHFFEAKEQDSSEIIVSFLEALGPIYIKAGQYLASLGYFNKDLQMKLLKLTSSVDPLDTFCIWHTIKEEYGDKASFIETLGPLLGTASVRQTHKCRIQGNQQRVIKIKRPEAVHNIESQTESFSDFIGKTRKDSSILGGVILPRNLVKQVENIIKQEILSAEDQNEQKRFHKDYEGKKISGKKLYIPMVDPELSTDLITVETEAPGEPLDRHLETITPKTKKGLLDFFLEMAFEKGKYHADPHPGNILEDEKDISLIDFGMVGELSHDNKFFFFNILKDLSNRDIEQFIADILSIHLYNGGNINELDMQIVKQEIDAFFADSAGSVVNFKDTSLQLLNTLEGLKIALPSELETLIKTISQLGYLIKGQEKEIQNWFTGAILKSSLFARKSKEINDAIDKAKKALESFGEISDMQKISKGALIRSTKSGKTFEIAEDVIIDPSKTISGEVFYIELTDFKLGIPPGSDRYEIQRAGKWVNLSDFIFKSQQNKK